MIFRFSQKSTTQEQKDKIKKFWKLIQTKAAKDLCVKVFFYRPYPAWSKKGVNVASTTLEFCKTRYAGNYRNINVHGFYSKDWELFKKYRIKSLITLKVGQEVPDKDLLYLMAHEWRHYLQYRNGKPKKFTRIELDARKYGHKKVDKILNCKGDNL